PHRVGGTRARSRPTVVGRRVASRHHRDRVPGQLGHGASHEHLDPPRRARRRRRGRRPGAVGPRWRGAMRPLPTQLPRGARIYLPDEGVRKRHVERGLFDVFRRWGYREIVTPTFEFADVLATGTDVAMQANMFQLVDRETGRMLALRADITPQI